MHIDINDQDESGVPLKVKKPYECKMCGARFRQKGNLTVHEVLEFFVVFLS